MVMKYQNTLSLTYSKIRCVYIVYGICVLGSRLVINNYYRTWIDCTHPINNINITCFTAF